MPATKVVLSNGEGDELELGPFNQGVVFKQDDIIDLASGKVIASDLRAEMDWNPIWVRAEDQQSHELHDAIWAGRKAGYRDVFIQLTCPRYSSGKCTTSSSSRRRSGRSAGA
jgi:hypothetical protein